MIQPVRTVHHRAFVALAIVLPAVLVAGLSLFNAYRVLVEQWRIAFEIGQRNRERGARPSSVAELIRMVRDYRRLAWEYSE